ncbi:TetR family transcriptional regulator [Arthrobacter jiangjiafuii]|uniref:TetR family transcriptional regulator n=1 Tax=Arthrobacter jiangjiafuii TaxID=2817475 RepID=A0A975M5K7_9MICC|nr:TetR family transcriptional regulator [Arthrobacter jiangjiafuii]MBP3044769.1 TetR family transcriptional regulator [Arthrobacter jiangjiafuii]QWC10403.1 TetR family transcriptional regulator [Arthrobacter jiangjiafuii]
MAATDKSEQTRRLLLETALELFRSQGYAKTTMRSIAEAAEVSVGNAYYYFRSKDELVAELYRFLQDEHRTRSLPLLREGHNLGEHLRLILLANLEVMGPYHDFGAHFMRTAMPSSGRAPAYSRHAAGAGVGRAKSIALFRQAVTRSRPQPPLAIRDDLPELLWLVHMGVTLFWIYDRSPGQHRSRRLVENVAPLAAKLVILSRLPVVRNIVEDVVRLFQGARAHD